MDMRLTLMTLFLVSALYAQQQPRLVVGIVVDQMRYEYLFKYEAHYGEDGFKRLLRDGYSFQENYCNYTPTMTAPGHATIYTGTTPALHGIIGNSWFARERGEEISNVDDMSVTLVGSAIPNPYGVSPVHLLQQTIVDQLELATGGKARTLSLSLKDRGAIQPGGHSVDAAYWYDWESSPGYFVSSTYYMKELPKWVERFNEDNHADRYLAQPWETLKPLVEYRESEPDNSPYELAIAGKETPTFPYDFNLVKPLYENRPGFYKYMLGIPAGNTLLREFAETAIDRERLGRDAVTDMLCISFSVPDAAGHTYGTESVELQDIYMRLDRELANLMNTLDQRVGIGNYLLMLTSDHGSTPPVSYLHHQGLPAGLAPIPKFRQDLMFYLAKKYTAQDWILHFGEDQIYLNHQHIAEKGIPLETFQEDVATFMRQQPGVHLALTASELSRKPVLTGVGAKILAGFYPDRSGDVLLAYEPGVQPTFNFRLQVEDVKGSGHGSAYPEDSHVPLLWYGLGISPGQSTREVNPTAIAPTLSRLMGIPAPKGSTGESLFEIFEK